MAVSLEALADALRITNPQQPEMADALAHWLRAARELVYVRAPTAPIAIADAAIIKAAGYWFDQETVSRRASFANAMTNSGALRLLGPWIVRRTAGAEALDALIGGPSLTPTVATYGIASGWQSAGIVLGIPDPISTPAESDFTEHGTGLEINLPISSTSGYLLLWLEDRTAPGNAVTISYGEIVRPNAPNTQLTYQSGGPVTFELNGKQGHIFFSGSPLVSLSQLFGAATIRVVLQE